MTDHVTERVCSPLFSLARRVVCVGIDWLQFREHVRPCAWCIGVRVVR